MSHIVRKCKGCGDSMWVWNYGVVSRGGELSRWKCNFCLRKKALEKKGGADGEEDGKEEDEEDEEGRVILQEHADQQLLRGPLVEKQKAQKRKVFARSSIRAFMCVMTCACEI